MHEDLFAEVSSLFCGGHASDWLSYIFDTCNCLVPKPESDYVPTDHFLEVEKRLENLGWLLDKYFPSAIEHNKEIRKKALSLLTNPSCSSFDKIVSHIADKSEKFLFFVLQMSIHESNTWLDGSDAHLLDQIPYHTVDKFSLSVPPDCLCQYYQIITKESSHFATFPRKLVEPCILAGSSEYGCCPECGAPWERVVEKSNPTKQNAGGKLQQLKESGYRNDGNVRMDDPVSKTIDWRPTCNCLSDDTTQGSYYDPGGGVGIPFDPEPCTVCDIFGGSGTTGLEAERLGRKWILIEKSPEYIEMAKRRLQEQISDPEYWEREAERIEVDTGQMSMF